MSFHLHFNFVIVRFDDIYMRIDYGGGRETPMDPFDLNVSRR